MHLLVDAFDAGLFDRTPRCAELVPKPHEGGELLHQQVLELRSTVRAEQLRDDSGPKDAACNSTSDFSRVQVEYWFQ